MTRHYCDRCNEQIYFHGPNPSGLHGCALVKERALRDDQIKDMCNSCWIDLFDEFNRTITRVKRPQSTGEPAQPPD